MAAVMPLGNALDRHGRCQGFSLIEALVALVLAASAVMALLELQGRSLSHTRQTVQRMQAIYLADDMLEMLRAAGADQRSALYLLPGQEVSEVTDRVCEYPASLACWYGRVATALTNDEQLLAQHVHVCPSDTEGLCTGSGDVVEVQLAWRSSALHCADFDRDHQLCRYRVRGRLP